MLIGYARVSTDDQVTHAQTDALKAAGCTVIYQETKSGGTMARPELQTMLAGLQPGDVVIVHKLDRVTRDLRDLLFIQDKVTEAGATLRSLSEAFDTASPAGSMLFHVLGAFAQFERAMIRERTTKGLHAAMARGARPGQPRKISQAQEPEALALWCSGKFTKSELAQRYQVHISSIKRLIARAGMQQGKPELSF